MQREVTLGNKIATVTLELNQNRQQDADGGTIDRKSRASTKGKEPNVACKELKCHVG